MAWLRTLVDWQQETRDPGEFLDSLRFEINAQEVFVFTPKGEVMALPAGLHPGRLRLRRAHRGRPPHHGRTVNGKLVPLNSDLNHGDLVEVFTSKAEGAGPSQDWQNFVKSPRARNKIRQWFSKERREEAIEQGKDLLTRAMRKQNLPLQKLMTHDALAAIAAGLQLRGHLRRSTPPSATGTSRRSPSSERLVHGLGGNQDAGRGRSRVCRSPPGRQPATVLRIRRRRPRRGRCAGQAGPVLHPGAAGRHHSGSSPRGSGVSVHRRTALT